MPNSVWPLFWTLPSANPSSFAAQNRDVAVIMSAQEYERMRDLAAVDFQRFCDRIGAQAKARGLTESALRKLLKD